MRQHGLLRSLGRARSAHGHHAPLSPLLACSLTTCASKDYMDPNIPTKGFFTNVRHMFDLRDVVVDVQGA
jgi:hypothetical protein